MSVLGKRKRKRDDNLARSYIVIKSGALNDDELVNIIKIFELEYNWNVHDDFKKYDKYPRTACDFFDCKAYKDCKSEAYKYYNNIKKSDDNYFLIMKINDNIVGYLSFMKILKDKKFYKDEVEYDVFWGDILCSFGRLRENFDIVTEFKKQNPSSKSIGKYAFDSMNEYITNTLKCDNYIFIIHPTSESRSFHKSNNMLPDNKVNTALIDIKDNDNNSLYQNLVKSNIGYIVTSEIIDLEKITLKDINHCIIENRNLENETPDNSYIKAYYFYKIVSPNQQGGLNFYYYKYFKYKKKYLTLKNKFVPF